GRARRPFGLPLALPRDLPRRWRRAKLMSRSRNIRRARRKTMARQSLNRRHFMGLSGAGIAGLVCPHSSALAQINLAQEPDLVVLNPKVYTVDPPEPRVEAFAVKGGHFAAMGKTEDVKSLAGRRTQVFDARQMTVVPGCIDAHNHAPGAILLYDVIVGNPYQVEFVSIASIVDKLKERARATSAGFWVEGFFFDDTKVQDKRALSIHDLDQVSREHPVSVRHRGGHTTYYNSKAFELAGVTKSTPNSAAGTFDRDANGELNGRVTDRARNVFNRVGKRPTYSADQIALRNRDAL